jgi:putative membrane protein
MMLLLIAALLPGLTISSFTVAMLAIVVFSLINISIKPLLLLFTLPINLLTLGLFTFIVNALMFSLGASLISGFTVDSFITALLASVLLSLGSALVGDLTSKVATH